MKAVALTQSLPITHPESLVDLELPRPTARGRDILVEVRAISVNPVDTKVRKNRKPEGPLVLGWDAAGVVVECGPEVTGFSVGDEVYFAGDIRRPGTNSELCLVDERIVAKKPKSLGFAEAAALPLTALTAHEAFFSRMHIPRGDASRGKSLLIIGGSGGVGSIAIQLAKALTGLKVIATASRPESKAWAEKQGADHVLDHRQPLRPQLEALGLSYVDYAFCTSETDAYLPVLIDLVAPQGTVCFIVETKGPVNIGPAQQKSLTIAWELMFTRPLFQTDDMAEQQRILREVAELVDQGKLRSTLTRKLSPISAQTLREAHAQIESGTTVGKIVLEGWSAT